MLKPNFIEYLFENGLNGIFHLALERVFYSISHFVRKKRVIAFIIDLRQHILQRAMFNGEYLENGCGTEGGRLDRIKDYTFV